MSKLRVGILQQASGVPAGFDAAAFVASALVDQDWTGLGGVPGSWSVTSGTPDYNVDGVTQTDGTAVTFELDISGLATQVPVGWLLLIVKFTEIYTIGFEGRVSDAGGTNYMLCSYTGIPSTEADGLVRRQEASGPLTCDASTIDEVFSSPHNSTMFFGATSVVSGGQVMEGTQWFNDDVDGNSFGLFSGGSCSTFTPTDADKIILTIDDVSTPGSTTLVRSLYWDTRPTTTDDFAAVATYLGWAP